MPKSPDYDLKFSGARANNMISNLAMKLVKMPTYTVKLQNITFFCKTIAKTCEEA